MGAYWDAVKDEQNRLADEESLEATEQEGVARQREYDNETERFKSQAGRQLPRPALLAVERDERYLGGMLTVIGVVVGGWLVWLGVLGAWSMGLRMAGR